MKTVIEFGVKGGMHTDNQVFPTIESGQKMASALVMVFTNSNDSPIARKDWTVSRKMPRISWENATHFVALSILDDVARGPASAKLWKK